MFARALVLLSLVVFAVVPGFAWAQEGKIPVSVDHTGRDNAGSGLAFAVREAVRASNGYRLVPDNAILRISIVTLDPSVKDDGLTTAAAVSYTMRNDLPYEKGNPQTWYPIYLSTSVVVAGANRLDAQAKGILASLDKEVQAYLLEMRKE